MNHTLSDSTQLLQTPRPRVLLPLPQRQLLLRRLQLLHQLHRLLRRRQGVQDAHAQVPALPTPELAGKFKFPIRGQSAQQGQLDCWA